MSVEAITWALAQPVKHSTAKFVLVVLANCADADMICWPSTAHICEQTSQDRKTVQLNLQRLREAGFIEDTSERKGSTKQVIVYRLKSPKNGPVKEAQKRNSTENGTGPNFPPNRPVFPAKEAQISHETGPKTGHGTIMEPSMEPSGNRHIAKAPKNPPAALPVLPDWMPMESWNGFVDMRKRKGKPMTERAQILIVKTLSALRDGGHDVESILDRSTVNAWTDVWAPKPEMKPSRQMPEDLAATNARNNAEARRLLFGNDELRTIDG